MLRKIIEYKGELRNCKVVIANRGFQVQKHAQTVGKIKEDLTLADRIFSCHCGLEIDRDLNAAINLNKWGVDALKPTLKKRTSEFSKTAVPMVA